ncbi:RHS repeat-associated core domain-containing protein [Pseudomonas sp. BW16M2]|uniref:RHS repeat-associated core domain-containing protein n=1 Tax=Pseudomonas sp. BW16M2 TaxID=2745489 RepID=UPI0016460728|nr:RHS repeat-associated core domain-containing protein [Pseudomonas sp. BW16M2]MBC3438288.1 RHS repeat-associated core domain-containing protein [Pseudomonas sp. BW16M2]
MTDLSRNRYAQQSMMLQTDAAGCVMGGRGVAHFRLAYTAYGQLPELIRIGLLGYNGQLLERDSQGYLLGNGHRLYDPQLMRFVCPDALSPFGEGGLNAYMYCGGDPVNNVDPSGRWSISGVLKWLGLRQKTGVTAAARLYDLPKSEVKDHYKSLDAPTDGRVDMKPFLSGGNRYVISRTKQGILLTKATNSSSDGQRRGRSNNRAVNPTANMAGAVSYSPFDVSAYNAPEYEPRDYVIIVPQSNSPSEDRNSLRSST